MPALEQRMIAVNGATLEVFVGGDGGPLVVEAHPFGGYQGQVEAQDQALAAARLVQVNGRGSGGSSPGRTAADYGFAQFIDDLEGVRQHLGGEQWFYLGTSPGVYAALHYARRAPHALRGLITGFLGPNLRQIVDDPRSVVSAAHPSHQALLAALEQAQAAPSASEVAGWVPVDERTWIWYEQGRPVCVYPFAMAEHTRAYRAEMLTAAVDDHLERIALPTLIFAGRYDPLAPLAYVETLQRIPGAEFVVVECGHADMDEGYDYATYQTALQRFLTDRSHTA